jgi:hypothetical protein
LTVAALAAGALAYATIPDTNGVVHGCYKVQQGALRVIDTEQGQTCLSIERSLVWSQTGQQGEQGPPGTSGWEKKTGVETFTAPFTSVDPTDYQAFVVCSAGKKVLGGGALVQWFDAAGGDVQTGYVAVDAPVGNDIGWFARAEQPTSAAVASMKVSVYAICANVG